jgi:AcrR family transcriptional regulator
MKRGSGPGRRRAVPTPRRYDATARQAEAQRTAARIVEVATDLVKEGVHPEEISYADLAARAEVATRTVYRHFPELSDLTTAVAAGTMRRVVGDEVAADRPAMAAQLGRLHEVLGADPKLFRIFIETPLRADIDYAGYVKHMFADVLERIPARHRDATAATIEALSNPYVWEVMHSLWGLPREQITRTCLAAIQAVTDRFQREPELLDAKAPLPPMFRNVNTRKDETHARQRTR